MCLNRRAPNRKKKDAALEREVAQNAAAAGRQQALCAQLQQEADALSENYNKLQDDIKAKETALEKVRGQGAVLEERILQSRKAGVRLSQQNEKLEQQVASLEKQLVSLTDEYDVLEKKADGGRFAGAETYAWAGRKKKRLYKKPGRKQTA